MRTLTSRWSGSTIHCFDSVEEVVEACSGRQYQSLDQEATGMRLPTWESVLAAIDRPWQQGLQAVDKFVAQLEQREMPELRYVKRRINYEEGDGDEIDLDRLRAGQPYWRISRRESVIGPTEVTIVTDVSAEKFVSPTDILWRGAAAVAMAKILEDRGYSVGLWVTRCSCPFASSSGNGDADSSNRVTVAICLKQPGDRLDVSTLVNAVSGWFYRTVLVTLTKTLAAREGKKLAKGLGTPERPYGSELDLFTSEVNRLCSMSSFSYSGAMSAVEWGLEKVKQSQEPPVPVHDDEPDPEPVKAVTEAKKPEPPRPEKKPKKVKMVKLRKIKVPKRPTEL